MRHGTLTNRPTWVPTPYGSGVALDATNDYISCGTGFGTRAELTVAALVQFSDITADRCIAGQWTTGIPGQWLLQMDLASGASGHNRIIGLVLQAAGDSSGWPWCETAADAVAVGQWYHILATWRSGIGAQIYVNGADATAWSQNETKPTTIFDTVDHRIGYLPSSMKPMSGSIAYQMVWNRWMAPREAIAHMADPYAMFELSPSLVVRRWWPGGAAYKDAALSGSVATAGASSGTVVAHPALSGSATGGGSSSGDVLVPPAVAGSVTAGGSSSGAILAPIGLSAPVSAGGTSSGTVTAHPALSAQVAAGGSSSGTVIAPAAMDRAVAVGGTSSGSVVCPLAISATVIAGGSSSGTVPAGYKAAALSASVAAGGTSSGVVICPVALLGAIAAGGSSSGTIPLWEMRRTELVIDARPDKLIIDARPTVLIID
jgi:hypothetical protein